MSLDSSHWIMFGLGILIGGILFSATFRVRFFKGLRNFLGGIGKGARNLNNQYKGLPGQRPSIKGRPDYSNKTPLYDKNRNFIGFKEDMYSDEG